MKKNYVLRVFSMSVFFAAFALCGFKSFGYTVTELQATYSNGQVFLTWKNPVATNLKYKLYRSSSPITSSAQLTPANYVGYVRDNSAKNQRKSKLYGGTPYYFVINPNNGPLASDRGLYVATSTTTASYFYAVTVVNLVNNDEDKTITGGSNSISTPVAEAVSKPKPVLQLTSNVEPGVVKDEYVIWGDNLTTSVYPAFNNAGSYGYNFTVFERGNSNGGPVYVFYNDDNPFISNGTNVCTDCNVVKLDDRLPNSQNTYWVGFNENFDMYSNINPVATTGTVKLYTQKRVKEIIQWARKNMDVDSNMVYLLGGSHNGFGVLLSSMLFPEIIAAAYPQKAPILIKAANGSMYEDQWSDNSLELPSDLVDATTGQAIPIWTALKMSYWYRANYNKGIPYMQGINGKKDVTVGWIQKFHWYDTLDATRQGGTWYWDQRTHNNTGAQFIETEITPEFERFRLDRSYPAFAYCSINQDPGNGSVSNGDPYGAINGYLDWDDESISDEKCKYVITCFVKDFYMGGSLIPAQFDSCTTDLTLRRVQEFNPAIGQKINWTVKKNGNITVQQGSFFYNGGPITLYGVKVYRSNSTISLTIKNCQKANGEQETASALEVIRTNSGFDLSFDLAAADHISLNVFDLAGRLVEHKVSDLPAGENMLHVRNLNSGMYVVRLDGMYIHETTKLVME